MERGTFLNNKKIPCSIHESYAIMDRAEERKKIVFWFIVPLNKGKNSQRGVEVGLDLKTKSTCTLKSSCVRVCSLHFWQKVNHSQWIIFSLSLSFSSFFFFFGKSATNPRLRQFGHNQHVARNLGLNSGSLCSSRSHTNRGSWHPQWGTCSHR